MSLRFFGSPMPIEAGAAGTSAASDNPFAILCCSARTTESFFPAANSLADNASLPIASTYLLPIIFRIIGVSSAIPRITGFNSVLVLPVRRPAPSNALAIAGPP
jgi:hypothetical protein